MKNITHRFNSRILIFVLIIVVTACSSTRSYVGIEPISPIPEKNYMGPLSFVSIDTLTPTLEWKPAETEGVSYDLAIWKKPEGPVYLWSIQYNKLDYYVENLRQTKHTVNEPLTPDTDYLWSVRPRVDGIAGAWSTYKETSITSFAVKHLADMPFSFHTPSAR